MNKILTISFLVIIAASLSVGSAKDNFSITSDAFTVSDAGVIIDVGGQVTITDGLVVNPGTNEPVNIVANNNGVVNAVTIGNDDAADTLEVNADTTIDGQVGFNGKTPAAAPNYTVATQCNDRDTGGGFATDNQDNIECIIQDLIAIGLFQ